MFIYAGLYLSIWIQKWAALLLYRSISSVLWRLRFVYNSTDNETLNIQHHINDILTIRVGCRRTPHKSWVMLGYNCHDSSYFCYIKLYRCKYGNTEATGSRPCVCIRQQNNKGEQFKTCYISESVSNAYNLILSSCTFIFSLFKSMNWLKSILLL